MFYQIASLFCDEINKRLQNVVGKLQIFNLTLIMIHLCVVNGVNTI